VAGHLAHICRHPIKAAGVEELARVALAPGAALPFDRHWAVAHEGARLKPGAWGVKANFLRGVTGHGLMAVRASLDEGARRVTLAHPEAGTIAAAPDDPADAARLIDWLAPLWPADRPAPARIVHVPGQAMTDWPDPFVSVLNLASLDALGQRLGRALSIHRFRGNLWLDGLAPWAEFGLVGREIALGPVRLRVERPITRCAATTVNPDTGRADADTLGALRDGFGHQDFGVYATVIAGGPIAVGDPVSP